MKPTDSHSPTDFAWTADRLLSIRRCVVHGLFGKKHWATPWVMGLCDADSSFLAHLTDQPRGYVHFLCLVRLALLEKSDARTPAELAHWIRTTGKTKILRSLSYPNGTAGMLNKLQKKPLDKTVYRRFVRMLADKKTQKYIQHIKEIKKFDVLLLNWFFEYIPEEYRCKGVLDCIDDEHHCFILLAHIRLVQHFNIKMTPAEVSAETKMLKDIENLDSWFKDKFKRIPFPPPPWEGNERIKPVRSHDELETVADKFENCLKSFGCKAALGYDCFYVCEDTPAVIRLVKDAVLGWGVERILGIKNKKLSTPQHRKLCRAFANADIHLNGFHLNW